MREESECPETVIERHEHDAVAGEGAAVVVAVGSGSPHVTATVQPHHHGKWTRACERRPDVERETILAHRLTAAAEARVARRLALQARRSVIVSLPCPRPRKRCGRRPPTQVAGGRRGVRNSEKHGHTVACFARQHAAFDANARRARIRIAGARIVGKASGQRNSCNDRAHYAPRNNPKHARPILRTHAASSRAGTSRVRFRTKITRSTTMMEASERRTLTAMGGYRFARARREHS